MHYLHLVVVHAKSPTDAYDIVDKLLDECEESCKGDWWVLGGSVSSDNKVDIRNEEARWTPGKNETVDSVNGMVKGWLGEDKSDVIGLNFMREHLDGKKLDYYSFMSIERYIKKQKALSDIDPATFNVLHSSFDAFNLKDCGVTNICEEEDCNSIDFIKNKKEYIVFVDMHN